MKDVQEMSSEELMVEGDGVMGKGRCSQQAQAKIIRIKKVQCQRT